MQPAELASRPNTANDRASRFAPGTTARQNSTAAPGIGWVTPVLHRANPGAARDERLFGWPATRSRVMLPLEPSIHASPDTSLEAGTRTAPGPFRPTSAPAARSAVENPSYPYLTGLGALSG